MNNHRIFIRIFCKYHLQKLKISMGLGLNPLCAIQSLHLVRIDIIIIKAIV